MSSKIIQQGAEVIILKDCLEITKSRVEKGYRLKELDEKIRKRRTKSEGKLLGKAYEIIPVPKIKKIDENSKEIIMEFIEGKKLSEFLNNFTLKKQREICKKIGESVAKLHDKDIIHGDLTTSNMILKNNKVYFIDFGLGFISHKPEDKAVDIHLLKQALEAKHFENWEELFKEFSKGYKKSENQKIISKRLNVVEKRGRYRY